MFDSSCWTVDICGDECDAQFEALNPFVAEAIKSMAANHLWRATGQRYGLCERTYRPCRKECGQWGPAGLPFPVRLGGEWFNMSCGSCRGTCGCDLVSEVQLSNVDSVVRVNIDGTNLVDPASMVAVYDRRRLIRIDGGQWPSCQNLSQTGGVGFWSVTVMQGIPVPPGGEFMAGVLACELAKACSGSDSCRLPRRLQTLTRNGVTIGFQDFFENLPSLRTGLWEVDSWIEANRFTGNRQPTITSPDRPRPSMLTWPVEP